MVEEVGDLNYRLTLPLYMKTHPVFNGGRLKRYVNPNEVSYPHLDLESEAKDPPPTYDPYYNVVDSESEEHHASSADPLTIMSHESQSNP